MHPGTENGLRWLTPNPNLPEPQRTIAQSFYSMAVSLVDECDEGIETTAGLRKMVEAKDCFVRASIDKRDQLAAEREAEARSLEAQRQVAD